MACLLTIPHRSKKKGVTSVSETEMSTAEYLIIHRAQLSAIEKEYLSPKFGSREDRKEVVFEPEEARVTVMVGGSLARIQPERPRGREGVAPPAREEGDLVRFSAASRNRLMRMIASTVRDDRPLFVTLTYPDEFPDEKGQWKRDIDVFGKRFRRQFPQSSYVWRIEFQERKSGDSEGKIAPHYHLLVWGVSIVDFRGWSDSAWYKVVGSGIADHLLAGVSSERIRKWGGTMAYVSKYIAKTDKFPQGWTGRVWGVVARDNMPWAAEVVIFVENNTAVRLLRLARKMMRLGGKVLTFGVTFLCNAERVLDYIEWAEGFM